MSTDTDTPEIDVRFRNEGTIVVFALASVAGLEWSQEHLELEGWQWVTQMSFAVDTRLAGDILQGMQDDGLTVVSA